MPKNKPREEKKPIGERISALLARTIRFVTYDIWRITENEVSGLKEIYINIIKTVILAVRGFQSENLQTKASALTYSTLLSIVPLLAVLLGIAKGFGFQGTVRQELFDYFPGHEMELNKAFEFVESYRGHGRLLGRKALITGGDSGIGRAVAIAFAREGADIAVNYLPAEQPDAASLRTLLDSEGSRLTLLPGDLSDEQSCRRIVRDAVRALDGLDTLVLNAGTQTALHGIEELSTEQLVRTFETNVFAMYWMAQEALPHLAEGASIIATSSIEAFSPNAHLLDYAATKSAIVGFTKALAKQLAPKGIRVNSVAPGPVWRTVPRKDSRIRKEHAARTRRTARRGGSGLRLPCVRRGELHHGADHRSDGRQVEVS